MSSSSPSWEGSWSTDPILGDLAAKPFEMDFCWEPGPGPSPDAIAGGSIAQLEEPFQKPDPRNGLLKRPSRPLQVEVQG